MKALLLLVNFIYAIQLGVDLKDDPEEDVIYDARTLKGMQL